MRLFHTPGQISTVFDDPNRVVGRAGSGDGWPSGPGSASWRQHDGADRQGRERGLKVASLVAGMVAGADSIDDMAMLRHGGMAKLFSRITRPRRGVVPARVHLGHIRQLDAIASRFLLDLVGLTGCSARRASRAQPRSKAGMRGRRG